MIKMPLQSIPVVGKLDRRIKLSNSSYSAPAIDFAIFVSIFCWSVFGELIVLRLQPTFNPKGKGK